jgi:hypothetical protein
VANVADGDGSNRKADVRWILMRLGSCFIGFNYPVLLPARRFVTGLRGLLLGARFRAAACFSFHRVQRRVSRAQEGIYFFAIFGINGNADADRQFWLPAISRKTAANTPGY